MSLAMGAAGWGLACVALTLTACQRRAFAARLELVARAAHELRRPLTAARLGLHSAGRALTEARWVGAVDAELRRAAAALADLDAARAGRRARERREPLELAAILAELAESWGRLARALGRELRVEAPPGRVRLVADRERVVQACGNLVANALEHGSGPIVLRARLASGRVRIEVADHGPGLPAPVSQLVSGARRGRGRRGRGLAIAAEIAARHGGRLAAAPSPGGARVALELPAVRP
jgi:signal transduction histidine kinase